MARTGHCIKGDFERYRLWVLKNCVVEVLLCGSDVVLLVYCFAF